MTSPIDSFHEALQQDAADLAALENCLDDEKTALTNRNHQLISDTASQKSKLLQNLKSRTKEKQIALVKAGFRPGNQSLADFLSRASSSVTLKLWRKVDEQLNYCKDLNVRNGKIIVRARNRTAKLMNILRGQAEAPALYGKYGVEKAPGGGGSLAKA